MRIPRIYLQETLQAGQPISLPEAISRHLMRVLRLGPGAPLILFNGEGREYPGKMMSTHRKGELLVQVGAPGAEEPLPRLRIHLGIGISRSERLDFALQKAVELGVSDLTPLFTERCVVRLSEERQARRRTHWQGILIAACEQSGRCRVPVLHPGERLDSWLERPHPGPLLLDHRARLSLPECPPPPAGGLTLLIGPEGGLSPGERERARNAGFTGVCLGPRILRAETAPLAALAIAQALWGDLRDRSW